VGWLHPSQKLIHLKALLNSVTNLLIPYKHSEFHDQLRDSVQIEHYSLESVITLHPPPTGSTAPLGPGLYFSVS
jgi:hypothetical protein